MSRLYDRYQQGFYQEVYDELLNMQEQIFAEQVYQDALRVSTEMMRRVKYNIVLLTSRLQSLQYQFGGSWPLR